MPSMSKHHACIVNIRLFQHYSFPIASLIIKVDKQYKSGGMNEGHSMILQSVKKSAK